MSPTLPLTFSPDMAHPAPLLMVETTSYGIAQHQVSYYDRQLYLTRPAQVKRLHA